MKFGAMVVPRAGDWQRFAELEQMGYDSAWVPDSQMIYSDTYAVLALAAANTSRIRLGPGVADAQETAALRDFDPAYVSSGSTPDLTVWALECAPDGGQFYAAFLTGCWAWRSSYCAGDR